MKTSQNGIDLIKQFEGCKLNAYLCPSGVPTIGYGHTAGVKLGQTITQQQADDFLRSDLEKFEKKVLKYDNVYHWNQNEFDAMVSFAYNVGSIDGLCKNGTRTKDEIKAALPLYNKGNGKELPGLVRRRNAELELFSRPVSGSTSTTSTTTVKTESTNVDNNTFKNIIKELQTALNTEYGCKLSVDGCPGQKTYNATPTLNISIDNKKPMTVKAFQKLLVNAGYNCTINGKFDNTTKTAVINYQRNVVKLKTPDGEFTTKGSSWKKILKL